jgi:hypothetical protein
MRSLVLLQGKNKKKWEYIFSYTPIKKNKRQKMSLTDNEKIGIGVGVGVPLGLLAIALLIFIALAWYDPNSWAGRKWARLRGGSTDTAPLLTDLQQQQPSDQQGLDGVEQLSAYSLSFF